MENVTKLQNSVSNLGSAITPLESLITDLLTTSKTDIDSLSPIQQAEYYSTLTYALDSIIFAYLKSVGVDPKTHAIAGELDRVKVLMANLKKARGEKRK